MYDVTTWETKNCNTHIANNHTKKFSQLIEYNLRNVFLKKPCTKYGGEIILRPFSKKKNQN